MHCNKKSLGFTSLRTLYNLTGIIKLSYNARRKPDMLQETRLRSMQ